jgi:branched-chain amino acid transport system permease protein
LIILEGLRLQGIGGFKGFIGPFYVLPSFFDGKVKMAGVLIDYQRLIVMGGGFATVAFLWFFTHHTKIGLSLRAIAQDEQAAMMLGIDSDRAAVIALSIGSALAGLAAVIILPLGNVVVEEDTGFLSMLLPFASSAGLAVVYGQCWRHSF